MLKEIQNNRVYLFERNHNPVRVDLLWRHLESLVRPWQSVRFSLSLVFERRGHFFLYCRPDLLDVCHDSPLVNPLAPLQLANRRLNWAIFSTFDRECDRFRPLERIKTSLAECAERRFVHIVDVVVHSFATGVSGVEPLPMSVARRVRNDILEPAEAGQFVFRPESSRFWSGVDDPPQFVVLVQVLAEVIAQLRPQDSVLHRVPPVTHAVCNKLV